MRIQKITHKNCRYICIAILISLLVVLVIIPFWRQGIICNDELQNRFWAGLGFGRYFSYYFDETLERARVLSAPAIIMSYLGFLSQDAVIFKIEQIVVLLICSLLFGLFINLCFSNKKFAIFCSISLLVFIPISFEPTIPNSYNSLFGIPVAIVLLSLILYKKYLDKGSSRLLIASMFCFLLSCFSYEAFITIAPIYVLIAFFFSSGSRKKKGIIVVILTGVVYLVLYITVAICFPSNYEGNTIANPIDLPNSLSIVLDLLFTNIPGYYLISPKYQYLTQYIINNDALVLRALSIVALYFVLIIILTRNKEHNKIESISNMQTKKVLVIGLLASVLPFLPTSISQMYQHTIGESGFIALPCSFFSYFGIISTICFITWQILKKNNNVHTYVTLVFVLFIILAPIQMANANYSEEQQNDYNRLVMIEDFIKSDCLFQIGGDSYKSPDLYETHLALAIHEGYWTTYSAEYGHHPVNITSEVPQDLDDNRIYLDYNNLFVIWEQGDPILVSKDDVSGILKVTYMGEETIDVIVTEKIEINDWFMYRCMI